MLVALSHMQISVCMFDGRQHSTGITRFRKNNICFPQRLSELQQHEIFLTNLQVNDIVNVPSVHDSSDASLATDVVRARVLAIQADGILVRVQQEPDNRIVPKNHIQARLTLPWKPRDVSHALIVLRRRNRMTDEYIEDLRVRRNFVIALLRCLSELGHWRENCGEDPMHKYYTDFDWLDD